MWNKSLVREFVGLEVVCSIPGPVDVYLDLVETGEQ